MQDDYNRFIRNSIRRAQCNYEDIFDEDAESHKSNSFCCGNVQSEQSNKCGCGNVQSEQSNKCGCGNVQSEQSNKCGCGNVQSEQSNKCGCGNVQSEQIPHCECDQMCRPVNEVPVMVFIEMQKFGKMYNEAEGLKRGTMFPALDKPFMGGGCNC